MKTDPSKRERLLSSITCLKCLYERLFHIFIVRKQPYSHALFAHHEEVILSRFEFLIRQGPEGDDEDSCGMNMIGKIPEGEA
ncbi:hypothetical protein CEH05_01820 [Halobacillus halophilus]|nr:hypothetical protein CEH05_01820 [Halobacillus halophilus]